MEEKLQTWSPGEGHQQHLHDVGSPCTHSVYQIMVYIYRKLHKDKEKKGEKDVYVENRKEYWPLTSPSLPFSAIFHPTHWCDQVHFHTAFSPLGVPQNMRPNGNMRTRYKYKAHQSVDLPNTMQQAKQVGCILNT